MPRVASEASILSALVPSPTRIPDAAKAGSDRGGNFEALIDEPGGKADGQTKSVAKPAERADTERVESAPSGTTAEAQPASLAELTPAPEPAAAVPAEARFPSIASAQSVVPELVHVLSPTPPPQIQNDQPTAKSETGEVALPGGIAPDEAVPDAASPAATPVPQVLVAPPTLVAAVTSAEMPAASAPAPTLDVLSGPSQGTALTPADAAKAGTVPVLDHAAPSAPLGGTAAANAPPSVPQHAEPNEAPAAGAAPEIPTSKPPADAPAEPRTKSSAHPPAAEPAPSAADASSAAKPDAAPETALRTNDGSIAAKAAADAVQPFPLASAPPQGSAAPVQSTAAAAAAAAPAPAAPVPVAHLAIEIAAQAHAGKNRFEIRLDPPELGRIDVRLEIDRDGHVTSRMVVERSETLDLLKRDAPQLERALQQAGLKTSDSALEFSLRQQTSQHEHDATPQRAPSLIAVEDSAATVEIARQNYGRRLGLGSGIDIRV